MEKFVWAYIGAMLFLLFESFSENYITVDANDPSVYAVESSWWGWSQKMRVLNWMQTADYDYPGWMTKNDQGDYYMYIVEFDDFGPYGGESPIYP